jgi:predicted regulator of Ras-like GTPase activity (Roadblock/LC7/MglB family)
MQCISCWIWRFIGITKQVDTFPDAFKTMANVTDTLTLAAQIDGTLGVALGDWNTGFSLGQKSCDTSRFSEAVLEQGVALNSEVIKAKEKARAALNITDNIQDILITLEHQYHLICMSKTVKGVFFYLVLNRDKANLGLARLKLSEAEKGLQI